MSHHLLVVSVFSGPWTLTLPRALRTVLEIALSVKTKISHSDNFTQTHSYIELKGCRGLSWIVVDCRGLSQIAQDGRNP